MSNFGFHSEIRQGATRTKRSRSSKSAAAAPRPRAPPSSRKMARSTQRQSGRTTKSSPVRKDADDWRETKKRTKRTTTTNNDDRAGLTPMQRLSLRRDERLSRKKEPASEPGSPRAHYLERHRGESRSISPVPEQPAGDKDPVSKEVARCTKRMEALNFNIQAVKMQISHHSKQLRTLKTEWKSVRGSVGASTPVDGFDDIVLAIRDLEDRLSTKMTDTVETLEGDIDRINSTLYSLTESHNWWPFVVIRNTHIELSAALTKVAVAPGQIVLLWGEEEIRTRSTKEKSDLAAPQIWRQGRCLLADNTIANGLVCVQAGEQALVLPGRWEPEMPDSQDKLDSSDPDSYYEELVTTELTAGDTLGRGIVSEETEDVDSWESD